MGGLNSLAVPVAQRQQSYAMGCHPPRLLPANEGLSRGAAGSPRWDHNRREARSPQGLQPMQLVHRLVRAVAGVAMEQGVGWLADPSVVVAQPQRYR